MVAKARKLKEGDELQFGKPMPELELAEPPPPKQQYPVAIASGQVAGMPAQFATALESLRAIRLRCSTATATTGILTPAQHQRLTDLGEELRKIIPGLESLWREVDAMIAAGIGLPERKPAEETEW